MEELIKKLLEEFRDFKYEVNQRLESIETKVDRIETKLDFSTDK